ncbi:hypothetical protein BV372_01830 [Nostoc sp. T09]|uniref:YdcF family protein n=1 Tax=Nostoc sp. T09 TaxID=1932621 RepID=UPI000A3A028D|nr:YdcF family protein [Nostoc sp. T09]OUL37715.1 hypothetical protein BV372_01830 [Nostoc sp. T09]
MVSRRKLLKLIGLVLAVWISIIPAKIAIASYQAPIPQAIFVLGGDFARIEFAAKFGQSHSNLDIWISDVTSNLEYNRLIFHKFGVVDQRLRLDGRATDTVTNFTTLAADFVNQKLQHIYLITSDYHMRRAKAVATIVLGSQGIAVTPVIVPSRGDKSESPVRVLRDCGRSIFWILSGRSGASFNPRLN